MQLVILISKLQALDPAMKPKFDRLTAAVKGYLVRRLLKTEKMRNLIQTIHDTVELVLNLYEEGTANAGRVKPTVKPEDLALHSRLIQQVGLLNHCIPMVGQGQT